MILLSGFVRLLEEEFVKQVEAFARLSDTSNAKWHQEKLSEFKPNWLIIHSNETCLVCLGERP